MISLTTFLAGLTTVYVIHSLYTLSELYSVPTCKNEKGSKCLQPYLLKNPSMQVLIYTSLKYGQRSNLVWTSHLFKVDDDYEREIQIKIPEKVRNNGTMYTTLVLRELKDDDVKKEKVIWSVSKTTSLTTYTLPQPSEFKLMGDSEKTATQPPVDLNTPISHWHSKLFISIINQPHYLSRHNLPHEVGRHIKLLSDKEYLPVFYLDEFSLRVKDLLPLNSTSTLMPLQLIYKGTSFGKLRFWANLQASLTSYTSMGFTERDFDEVKSIFVDTNFVLLLLTFFVSAFHLLFDFLAFKNDISFWRNKKHMVGLSTWSISWRCFSSIIIFFFLLDKQTSLLVLIPSGISSIIEVWKVTKAFKIRVWMEGWRVRVSTGGNESAEELKTDAFDTQAMKKISYVLLPLVLLGAVYSLLYTPHKSWYSWTIQSLSNGVYAFGFIFMLPQLFINYKLKSVAHLPWKAFTYKAFNTFIDDVFAFIITMPTTHRLACFRDDVIFLIYLYQRWLYPVDKSRVNEFGQSFDEVKEGGANVEGGANGEGGDKKNQ